VAANHRGRPGEFALPEIVREDDEGIPTGNLAFVRPESPADLRYDSKRVEEIRGDREAQLQLRRRVRVNREANGYRCRSGKALERPVRIAEIDIIRIRDRTERRGASNRRPRRQGDDL
jgi:hypothetical protein